MIQRMEARTLSSKNEWSLIESSLPPVLKTLSLVRLKSKIARARRLRGKYQDLYRRQKLANKSTIIGRPHGRLNVRTQRKKQMFNEALSRLQMQLEKTSAPGKVSSRRPRLTTRILKIRSTSRARTHVRKATLRGQQLSLGASEVTPRKTAGYKRRQSHVAAATRRQQSRRDSRQHV
jgi:hypothetical protein